MNTFTLERNNYRRKLIMLVKQHPILWNKTQENYNRNRPQKILAWHQISQQLEIPVDKLRRTWENLRDQYRRDLKREVRFGFKSKWRFFSDMDFIRSMVSCKENEYKENEFTDSDSELDVTDNQNEKLQASSMDNNIMQTITTSCTSTTISNTTCPANILPFQPIVLSKQWQHSAEDRPQLHSTPATTSYCTENPPVPHNLVDSPKTCDSSKDCSTTPPTIAALHCENVAKQEPDLHLELDEISIAAEKQESTLSKDHQNAREFQEPCVSTSSNKRSRLSIDEISDTPIATTSRSQTKSETDLNAKDDDYYFVMSLLPSLRQIPRNRKFPLRIGIMSLIAKDLEEVCKE